MGTRVGIPVSCEGGGGRAVLTNGHTGHVPSWAPGFFFDGPPTGCGEINFFKQIILLHSPRSSVRETR